MSEAAVRIWLSSSHCLGVVALVMSCARPALATRPNPTAVHKADTHAARTKRAGRTKTSPPEKPRPQSKGAPNAGSLEGGRQWKDSKWALHMTRHEASATFALPELLRLVDGAARSVQRAFPRSMLLVGDMSKETGGAIVGHHSHQNGRDVDVGFYAADEKGRPVRMVQFSPFDSRGRSVVSPDVHFDDTRNWKLITTMLTDRHAEVRSIFIASWLRARLLAHAAKTNAPAALRERAAAVMMQPPNAEPHHDHFHVRIACPSASRGKGCFDDSFARPNQRSSAAGPSDDGLAHTD
jgi:penicillin-insensitive murein DD-endopeptidase